MRVVLALHAPNAPQGRDAQHVLAEQVRYHLEQGVDLVLSDATGEIAEILASLERGPRVQLVDSRDLAPDSLARLAVEDHAADWLLESGPGEFWWSRRGTLRELLGAAPSRFDTIRGLEREFVARPDADEPFFERTIARRRAPAGTSPRVRLVRRAGANEAPMLRDWYPLELLQFPVDECDPVGDDALTAGLADGSLCVDSRVRDALRGDVVAPPTLAEEAELAEELEALLATPEEASLFPAIDSLDRRLVALERAVALAPAGELRRRLRRRLRR